MFSGMLSGGSVDAGSSATGVNGFSSGLVYRRARACIVSVSFRRCVA